MAGKKVVDETHRIADRWGNGLLRREVWVDPRTGQVTRYNLAYINHRIFAGDNGRVIGYENAHDGHHRHVMGVVEPVPFVSFDDIEPRFEHDWLALKVPR